MARARASRALEFEDSDLSVPEEKVRRPRTKASEKEQPVSRRRILLAVVFLFFLIVLIAAVALAYQVDTFLATDSRFVLRPFQKNGLLIADGPIAIDGVEHVPTGEILAVFEPDVGRSLYLLPLDGRRRELLTIDWVDDATVTRMWPNRLQVSIRERVPLAMAAMPTRRRGDAYQMMLVDREGVLMRLPKSARFDLPVVFGLAVDQQVEYRRSRIELIESLQAEVRPLNTRFTELDLSDTGNVKASLALGGRNVKLLLGREKFLPRVRVFLQRFDELIKAHPQANLFDMRLDGQILASREGLGSE